MGAWHWFGISRHLNPVDPRATEGTEGSNVLHVLRAFVVNSASELAPLKNPYALKRILR
jgi:hypothetical protein